jgi:VPDSG-CTERM motif
VDPIAASISLTLDAGSVAAPKMRQSSAKKPQWGKSTSQRAQETAIHGIAAGELMLFLARIVTLRVFTSQNHIKIVRKYVLYTLLAIALACNANAKDKDKDKDKGGGTTYSVPDGGATFALLGLSFALIVLAQRKAAIIK